MIAHAVQLSPRFEPDRLRHDLMLLADEVRARQPGSHHDGSWKGMSLYNQGGDHLFAGTVKHGSRVVAPSATKLLESAGCFREMVGSLGTIQRARVSELPAGSVILEHRDRTSLHHRVCRIHVPVVTHPDVEFRIGGERVDFGEGETWYADFAQPHSVHNRSDLDRVHIVIDAIVTEELLTLFPPAYLADVRKRLGDFHVVPTGHAEGHPHESLSSRFAATFALPETLARFFEGRHARVAWDAAARAYRFFVDGARGRRLFAVDGETLELEDGRLTLHYRFEEGAPVGIEVEHYRYEETYDAELEERVPFRGVARLRFDDGEAVVATVVDSSDIGGSFHVPDVGRVRVHDKVSVELLREAGGSVALRAAGEVHWRDLTSGRGTIGVRYERDGDRYELLEPALG